MPGAYGNQTRNGDSHLKAIFVGVKIGSSVDEAEDNALGMGVDGESFWICATHVWGRKQTPARFRQTGH